MQLLIVVYDQGIDASVMELLSHLDLDGWTKQEDATGAGHTDPKMGDAIWPGLNNILWLELEDDHVEPVAKAFRHMQEAYRLQPGISLWSMPITAW